MTHRAPLAFCTLALLLTAACTQFPALDSRATPEMLAAQYPALVPVDPLLARATANQVNTARTQGNIEARVQSLQARAARLRGAVLSGPEKQRLANGLR